MSALGPKEDIAGHVASTFSMSGEWRPPLGLGATYMLPVECPCAAAQPVYTVTIIHKVEANVAWWIS
jgi:hypothetical protein